MGTADLGGASGQTDGASSGNLLLFLAPVQSMDGDAPEALGQDALSARSRISHSLILNHSTQRSRQPHQHV